MLPGLPLLREKSTRLFFVSSQASLTHYQTIMLRPDGDYYHFQRPVMINLTSQNTNQGAPTKISAPGIIIKTPVSAVAIQDIVATIGMIPKISTQQSMVIRRNID